MGTLLRGNIIVGNEYQNGTKKLVTGNLDSEFKAATQNVAVQSPVRVEPINPVSSVSFTKVGDRIVKRGNMDVTRNAPLFNDPRYTSSTLAIPTDDRTLHGLYRFFADTDPIVGAALRIHCLPEGEHILTDSGSKAIETIVPYGDKVIGHTGQWQSVTSTSRTFVKKRMYTIKVYGCPEMKMTDNHEVRIRAGKRIQTRSDSNKWSVDFDSPIVWKSADSLQIRDYTLYPKFKEVRPIVTLDLAMFLKLFSVTGQLLYTVTDATITRVSTKQIYPRYVKVDEDFAELAGWYVAEGWCNGGSNLAFALHKNEQDVIQRLKDLFKKIFGVDHILVDEVSENGIQVTICSALLAKVFGWLFGNHANQKKIDASIMYAEKSIVKAFLKAYIEGDGHESKYEIESVTVSPTLNFQLTRLATKLNIFFTTVKCKPKKLSKHNVEYVATAAKSIVYPLLYDKTPPQQLKQQPLAVCQDDDYFYLPIRKINSKEFEGYVYDIGTEDHSFLYRCIVHNSELPVANLQLGECEDSGVQAHFEEMAERINLIRTITDGVKEFWTIGNDYFFGAWNEKDYMFDQFTLLNPDYVKVESTWVNQKPLVKLIPDESLKKIVQSRSPDFLYKQLSPEIIRYVLYNNEIPLHPNNVFILSHDKAPYEVKGKSIIKRLLKILMYEDRLQQAQFAIATRHIVPLTVVKVGDPNSVQGDHYVTYKSLDGQLHIHTFDELWELLDGEIVETESGKFVKNIAHHRLQTQSLGSDGQYVWNPIEGILRHISPETMVEVDTATATITSTEAHGFVWLNPDTLKYEKVSPKQLAEREAPTLVTFEKFDYSIGANEVLGLPLTSGLAYILGLWTSDGSFYQDNATSLRISNLDYGVGQYLQELPKRTSLVDAVTVYTNKEHGDACYTLCTPNITNALLKYYEFENSKSRIKTGFEKIPIEVIFNNNKTIVGAFFAGVFDGDGTIRKNKRQIIVSCGISREYHHWLSLALLAQGIVSKVRCRKFKDGRKDNYEVHISNQDAMKRFILLVQNYVRHSKKRQLFTTLLHWKQSHQEKTNCFDISDEMRKILFDGGTTRLSDGSNPCSHVRRNVKRVSRDFILKHAVDKTPANFFSLAVNKLTHTAPKTKYVYDLMLSQVPNTYIVAGNGWSNTFNTGWVPEASELESLRDMFAAWELDPNFSIFYHYGIDVQFYGSTGKILPVGPEFDRVYKLKFIGMGIHEQLMTGAGGSYAQAYANLEIQRQRYLNLQLKIEQMVHIGWFKTVSEMCGFYRMSQPVVGSFYRGKKYGNVRDAGKDLLKQYSGIRDYQDNKEFKTFFVKKAQELKNEELTQRREYIYPKLDWGAMSATNDENYKNWIKWLKKEVPWMVDEATLARIARLDMNSQEKAFFRDINRRKRRETEIIQKGLAPWAQEKKPQGPIAGDFAGDTGMDVGLPPAGGTPDMSIAPAGGGLSVPEASPIGSAGAPTGGAAAGMPPSAPVAASKEPTTLEKLGEEMLAEVANEVGNTMQSNRPFFIEHTAIDQAVGK